MSKKEKIFPLNTFGGRMQDLRKNRLRISRPEFYDLIYPDVSTANESKSRTVKNWESGYCEPDLKTIIKICTVLKCSSDYLFGMNNCTNKDTQFIHDKTGLSEYSINGLQLLHFPIDSIWDSVQVSRYDIIALNIILEDFYNKMKKTPDYRKFGDETDTLLNCIGQYIDAGSAAIDITQNGTLKIYPSDEIVQAICRDKITLLLKELKDKYSLEIIGRRIENNERFKELYNDSIRGYLTNSEKQTEKNNGFI